MSTRATYAADCVVAYISRIVIYAGFVVLISTYLAGCSNTTNDVLDANRGQAVRPPLVLRGPDLDALTRNTTPQGGEYEKSDSAPCGPSGRLPEART